VASAGLVGNGYAESVLRGEIVLDSVKRSSEPLSGKIALEEHFVLAQLSNQVMQLETFTPKRDRKSSISTADVRVFGIGCWRSGGELSLAGARNAGSHGRTSILVWLSAGFLYRERSIPFLTLASPPVI